MSELKMSHKPGHLSIEFEWTGDSQAGGAAAGGAAAKGKGPTIDFTKPNNTISLSPLQPTYGSSTPSRNSGGTADILPMERKKASFQVEKLTNFLDGGEEKTARRRFIISPSEGTTMADKYYETRETQMKEHLRHFISIHKKFPGFVPTREEIGWMGDNAMSSGSMMNHWGLFMATVMSQASDEQMMAWALAGTSLKLVGCYAQTELGHGSNVRGLQTTAHFDIKTQEFVLNTPTLPSIKFWPGTLGKVCTHAVVYAQLIIDGHEHGPHAFMVQVRDENHRPLPGIELGDCGPKLGDPANDTGFMRLENVRIPRDMMFSKFQRVTEKGEYKVSKKKSNEKLGYATMMYTRGFMVRLAGGILARAVTIAMRYSCVRRQGFVDTSRNVSYKSLERQIIDYQVQRYRVFKQLALCYAMKFTGRWMTERFGELEGEGGMGGVIADTTHLGEIAATAAGLKAICTFLAWEGVEDCRKCCGGHGYLQNSGVASLAADYVWQTTAEGDFLVLMLQTARFLMKTLHDVRTSQGAAPISGPCSYMGKLRDAGWDLRKAAPNMMNKTAKDFRDLDFLVSLYNFRASVRVLSASEEQTRLVKTQGMSHDDAWNEGALLSVDAVKAHCSAFMLTTFIDTTRSAQDPAVRAALSKVCNLFALTGIVDEQWAGLGIIGHDQLRLARLTITELLNELRPDAVTLVDAFDIPDRVLNSTLGSHDGNVYEALYEAAKKSPMNQTDPFDGYHEYLRPHLDLELLKEKNRVPFASKL